MNYKNFEFKENKYRLINFDNEFTFEQGEFGKQIYTDIISSLGTINFETNNIGLMLSNLKVYDLLKIVSLIYVKNDGEPSETMYLENLETFKKLPAKKLKELEAGIKDFFIFITAFLMDVLQGYSRANTQAPKQTQKR